MEGELMQAIRKERQYGNDGTTLDDDVEKVALPRQANARR